MDLNRIHFIVSSVWWAQAFPPGSPAFALSVLCERPFAYPNISEVFVFFCWLPRLFIQRHCRYVCPIYWNILPLFTWNIFIYVIFSFHFVFSRIFSLFHAAPEKNNDLRLFHIYFVCCVFQCGSHILLYFIKKYYVHWLAFFVRIFRRISLVFFFFLLSRE